MLRQNTTTWSPGRICVSPVTRIPSPLRIIPPMVVPLGSPRSLIRCLVILAPSGTVNSATSALAKVRHFTLDTSASSSHFFIDNRAYVETLCHTDIVDVFHFCHRLFHSHTFGGETGKDIRFRVAGQGYKCFGIL